MAPMAPRATPKRSKSKHVEETRIKARSKWRLRGSGGLQILEAPILKTLGWLVHGFSTRSGGESKIETPPGRGEASEGILNLGFTEWDARDNVTSNRRRFFDSIGAGTMRAVTLHQIHSDIIQFVDKDESSLQASKADALIAREPGIVLAVQTADCVPILLADIKQHAVAAIHCGWRGTLRRLAAKVIGRMQMEFGTRPEDVVAALGPGTRVLLL